MPRGTWVGMRTRGRSRLDAQGSRRGQADRSETVGADFGFLAAQDDHGIDAGGETAEPIHEMSERTAPFAEGARADGKGQRGQVGATGQSSGYRSGTATSCTSSSSVILPGCEVRNSTHGTSWRSRSRRYAQPFRSNRRRTPQTTTELPDRPPRRSNRTGLLLDRRKPDSLARSRLSTSPPTLLTWIRLQQAD